MHLTLGSRTLIVAGVIGATLVACAGSSGPSNQVSGNNSGGTNVGGTNVGGTNVGGTDVGGTSSGGSTSVAGSSAGSGITTGGSGGGDLPCDVQAFVASKCLMCHRADPPGTLLSSADFQKNSKIDPTKTVGQVAVERLALTTNLRMPPAPLAPATDAERSALSAWVTAGAKAANCAQTVETPPNPYDTPVVCTSMTNWTGGNRESPQMRPGGACISCHQKEGEGPVFAVAGTLFPTPHEPNDCNGVGSTAGAHVVITESNGTVHTLSVNQAGNFFLESRSFTFPYQAKVVYQDRERVMVEAQRSGDCNDCHTQDGRENAPGRIFLP